MEKERISFFSDGFFAIIITIMVLEIKAPEQAGWNGLAEVAPALLSYMLSFLYIAIYWNNHHHMFHTIERVTGAMLWANMHLLFWISLVPFATGWMSENHHQTAPTATYGFVLLMCATAYFVLQHVIIRAQGGDSILRRAIGRDFKGKFSMLLYLAAIVGSFRLPMLSYILFAGVAALWLLPDPRIENMLTQKRGAAKQAARAYRQARVR